MEQNGYPGNIGDSCAETSRYAHLKDLLNEDRSDVDLQQFQTETGFVRHPTAPEGWREDDFSGDQALPLYLASRDNPSADPIYWKLRNSIETTGYKSGNGDFISPVFYGLVTDKQWLVSLSTAVQGLLFRFPYRWSDAYKNIERQEGSSADYLNYLHAAVYASPYARSFVSKATLKQKIRDYYEVEPNSLWLVQLYDRVIDLYWTK